MDLGLSKVIKTAQIYILQGPTWGSAIVWPSKAAGLEGYDWVSNGECVMLRPCAYASRLGIFDKNCQVDFRQRSHLAVGTQVDLAISTKKAKSTYSDLKCVSAKLVSNNAPTVGIICTSLVAFLVHISMRNAIL